MVCREAGLGAMVGPELAAMDARGSCDGGSGRRSPGGCNGKALGSQEDRVGLVLWEEEGRTGRRKGSKVALDDAKLRVGRKGQTQG